MIAETLNIAEVSGGSFDTETAGIVVDTRAVFERWLESLNSPPAPLDNNAQFFESVQPESHRIDHDVVFDGVLRVDGLLTKGSIRSAHGILVMTDHGHIKADVDVRVAHIDGYLEGNLRATEQVILDRNARVAGDIHTASLSIMDGAVFEGTSFVLERDVYSEMPGPETHSDPPRTPLMGAYRQSMRRQQETGLQFGYKARQ
jgi:cytoskeletal protein CcmA (bactofilin family)